MEREGPIARTIMAQSFCLWRRKLHRDAGFSLAKNATKVRCPPGAVVRATQFKPYASTTAIPVVPFAPRTIAV
jgi:hypothetical protein